MGRIRLPAADRAALADAFRTAPDHPARQRALSLLLLYARSHLGYPVGRPRVFDGDHRPVGRPVPGWRLWPPAPRRLAGEPAA